jgi:hypothetical protein
VSKLYKQDWNDVLNPSLKSSVPVFKDIITLRSKVINDTDKYRKIVQNAASKEIKDIKNA